MYNIENKALKEKVEWIKNNPYTEEILTISDIALLDAKEEIVVSEIQGAYPVDVKFTGMQKVSVTYRNKYYGVRTATIVAGFDAIRYKESRDMDMYEGGYMDRTIISVEFIGEYSKIIDTV